LSCDYTQDWVEIPKELVEKVKELVVQQGLKGVLAIDSDHGGKDGRKFFLWVENSDMGHHTANLISEKFMPELAKLLKGTECDFQAIDSECDGEHSTMVLADGKVLGFTGSPRIIHASEVNALVPGQVVTMPVTIKILPLGKGDALVVEGEMETGGGD
jgi:hypothetical protein